MYRYVRWEIELALEKGLPIIVVNLNGSRAQDQRCPAILRDKCVVHVPFKMNAIKVALDNWPDDLKKLDAAERLKGARYYSDSVYATVGI